MRIFFSTAALLILLAVAAFSGCKQDPVEPAPITEPEPTTVKVGSYFATATASAIDLNATVRGDAAITTGERPFPETLGWLFGGTNGYLEVPDSAGLKTEAITLSVMINVAETKTANGVFFKSNGQNAYDVGYGMFCTKNATFAGVASRDAMEPVAQYGYALNRWYHVAVTASKDSVILYVDGVKVAKKTGFDLKHAKTPLLIGRYPYANSYFKGILNDIRVYGVALSAEQVGALGPK